MKKTITTVCAFLALAFVFFVPAYIIGEASYFVEESYFPAWICYTGIGISFVFFWVVILAYIDTVCDGRA